ncbi:unnamed protein product [Boreogadus saida]
MGGSKMAALGWRHLEGLETHTKASAKQTQTTFLKRPRGRDRGPGEALIPAPGSPGRSDCCRGLRWI